MPHISKTCILTLGFSLPTGGTSAKIAAKNSGISKVVELLKGMKTDVDAETKKGAAEAEKMEDGCIKETTELESEITRLSEQAEESTARQEEQSSKAAAYTDTVETLGPEISNAEKQIKSSKAAFQKKDATMKKEEAELTEASAMLVKAHSVLKRSLGGGESLLQTSNNVVKEVKTALIGLSAVVASVGSATTKDSFQSFIEKDDDLSFKFLQQKKGSDSILSAIEDMQDDTEKELTSLSEKALKAKHAFELLSQDLTKKIEAKTAEQSQAVTIAAEANAKAGKAGAKAADVNEALSSAKTEFKDKKSECRAYKRDWEARLKDATEEMGVLDQAVGILEQKFSSDKAEEGAEEAAAAFIQLHMAKKLLSFDTDSSEVSDKLVSASEKLRKLGRSFDNFNLLQLADKVQSQGTSDKVVKMIGDLITKLEKEQADEAAKEGKCSADKKKGNKEMKARQQEMNKISARFDQAKAQMGVLASELSEASASVSTLQETQKNADATRASEKAENTAQIKEAKESVEALNEAVKVLSDFYGEKASDKAEAIIGILETAQEDFEKLRQTTERAENDAVSEYEKSSQDNEVNLAKTKALIEGKQSEQASLKKSVAQMDGDMAGATKALDSASAFLKGVNEQCAVKVETFEEKQAKRKAEIDGLKEAQEILSG